MQEVKLYSIYGSVLALKLLLLDKLRIKDNAGTSTEKAAVIIIVVAVIYLGLDKDCNFKVI